MACAVGDTALALVIFWIGFLVTTSPVLEEGLVEARMLPARLLLAGVLTNTPAVRVLLLVDLNNGLCQAVLEVGTPLDAVSLAALFGLFPLAFGDVVLLLPALAFLLVFVWLYLKMVYRLAGIMLALAVAPLVPLWVPPATQGWVGRLHNGPHWQARLPSAGALAGGGGRQNLQLVCQRCQGAAR